MAKEEPKRSSVKICFERIIPDEVDPERFVRREMRKMMVEHAGGGKLDPEAVGYHAKMAVINSKKWQPDQVVTCRFLDGSRTMQEKVEAIAHHWEKHCSVRLRFVQSQPADIRISFYADSGSWSAVGRDALNTNYFPKHQPTMNFGWLRDNTEADEYDRVVLHEFGHALGCVHEHSSPKFDRVWDRDAVMQYFQGPPNYWSPEDIEDNVLSKYSKKGVSATQYDPASIMLYAFDAALFSDGKGATNTNTKLSDTDKKMIHRMYP